MKFPTIKYQSGLEVSLAAFLLKMTSLDVDRAGNVLSTERVPTSRRRNPFISQPKGGAT